MIDIDSILKTATTAELQRLHDELHERGFLTVNAIAGRRRRLLVGLVDWRGLLRAARLGVLDAKKPRPRPRPPNPCKPCRPKKRHQLGLA
ncbi:MAG: hypothetical protein V3U03_17425 [Myxococcota bacterium]